MKIIPIANPVIPEIEQFHDTSFIELISQFKTENDCLEYLYNIKFSKGFKCSECGNDTSYVGYKPFSQVCRKCRHVETATTNTFFHKLKFGLVKAFMIIYDMSSTTKGISGRAIASKYNIAKNSAWLFMKRVRTSMESSGAYPMMGKVYVDEFVVGGYEKGAAGRKTNSKKIKAIMAVEVTNKNRIKRVYSMKLKNYSTEQLREIFDKHISKDALVFTDGWRSYNPLKEEWNITQDKNIKKSSPVNRMIQQQKSWLRAIYHKVSHHHSVDYFNEFSFRINRSQWKESIFHKCVERMVFKEKMCRFQLSQVQCLSREQFVSKVMLYETIKAPYVIDRYGKVRLAV